MKIFLAFLVALMMAAAADDAAAQTPTPIGASALGSEVTLSVTATSARVQLTSDPTAFNALTIVNTGTKDAFFLLGGSTAAAATTNTPIRSGKHITIWLNGATYVAAICGGTDTTSLDIYQANGSINLGP